MVNIVSDSQGIFQRPGNRRRDLALCLLYLLQCYSSTAFFFFFSLLIISSILTTNEEAFGRTFLLGDIPFCWPGELKSPLF